MKIFKRRKKQNEEKQEEEKIQVEVIDFDTNKITPLEEEFQKSQIQSDGSLYVTKDEFAKKINEIETKYNSEIEQIQDFISLTEKKINEIDDKLYALSNKESEINAKGKSDSREPVQEDNTATTDDNKEAIQKPDRRKRQENPLHNSPEQVVLP